MVLDMNLFAAAKGQKALLPDTFLVAE